MVIAGREQQHAEFEEVQMCAWQSCMHGRCGSLIVHAWTINEPHLPYKTGLDVMQSHPLRRTHFGMHRYIVPLIHTGNPHKTSRRLVAHVHAERKQVIVTWKHQKHMKKSALKQRPIRHSTNVHHYNTKPRRYIVSFIASAMLYLITIV